MGAFLVSTDPEHQGGWKHPVTGLRISSAGEGAGGLRGHRAGHEGGNLPEPQPQPEARLAQGLHGGLDPVLPRGSAPHLTLKGPTHPLGQDPGVCL